MKCNKIIKVVVYSLLIGILLFYLLDNQFYFFRSFFVNYLLLPIIVLSATLFFYSLYCLKNSRIEKLFALMLVVVIPMGAHFLMKYTLFPLPNDINLYLKTYQNMMLDKVIGNQNQESFDRSQNLSEEEFLDKLVNDMKETNQKHLAFDIQWNESLRYEGDVGIATKKIVTYKFIQTIFFGAVGLAALYLGLLYISASIIRVACMYVSVIMLGMMSYGNSVIYGFYEFWSHWLILIFLLMALVVVTWACCKRLKKINF